jgi:DNA-binding transcriptional regulator YdaS (Cro superfamily)
MPDSSSANAKRAGKVDGVFTPVIKTAERRTYVLTLHNTFVLNDGMKAETKALEDAIAKAGGPTALARSIGVSQSVVSNWLSRKSVPAEHCAAIDLATGVSRKRLRPKDWKRIWPELAA